MKTNSILRSLFFLVILFCYYEIHATNIPLKQAQIVAHQHLLLYQLSSDFQLADAHTFYGDSIPLFYIFEMEPKGFLYVTADTDLPPIIAYFFLNSFQLDSSDFIVKEGTHSLIFDCEFKNKGKDPMAKLEIRTLGSSEKLFLE